MPWSPSDLNFPMRWLDASNASSISIASGKVSTIQNTIPGYSDIGLDYFTGGGYGPSVVSAGLNGLDVLSFNGTNSRLSTSNKIADFTTSQLSVFVVSLLTGTNPGGIISMRPLTNLTGWSLRYNSKTTLYYYHLGYPPVSAALPADQYAIIEFIRNGNIVDLGVNGVMNGAIDVGGYVVSNQSAFIGAENNGTLNYISGRIAEIIIIGGAVTSSDRQKIEWYMANKWGLTSSLPVGHPYLNAITIGGNVIVLGGGPGDSVSVIDAVTNELISINNIDAGGDWAASVLDGQYYLLYVADGYQSQASGPHTVSSGGVSPAIPDIVLGSSSGTIKTVGYAF